MGENRGTVQTGGFTYTLSNVQSNHTVHVTFKPGNPPDTAVNLPKTGQLQSYASGDDGDIRAGVSCGQHQDLQMREMVRSRTS